VKSYCKIGIDRNTKNFYFVRERNGCVSYSDAFKIRHRFKPLWCAKENGDWLRWVKGHAAFAERGLQRYQAWLKCTNDMVIVNRRQSHMQLRCNVVQCLLHIACILLCSRESIFKSMCHPVITASIICYLLTEKVNIMTKIKRFYTILTTGVSPKLMTSLVWWLLLLLVPWSAWTVEASHGLSPLGSVFGHWCRISQIFATPLQNVINLSSCRSSRTTHTLDHSKQ